MADDTNQKRFWLRLVPDRFNIAKIFFCNRSSCIDIAHYRVGGSDNGKNHVDVRVLHQCVKSLGKLWEGQTSRGFLTFIQSGAPVFTFSMVSSERGGTVRLDIIAASAARAPILPLPVIIPIRLPRGRG